jgi:hypothetical protein
MISGPITVEFQDERQVQRILFLLHRDLARVVGNEVLATEQLEAHNRREIRLSGRQREKAQQTVNTTPEQEQVIRGAQSVLRDALKNAQQGR